MNAHTQTHTHFHRKRGCGRFLLVIAGGLVIYGFYPSVAFFISICFFFSFFCSCFLRFFLVVFKYFFIQILNIIHTEHGEELLYFQRDALYKFLVNRSYVSLQETSSNQSCLILCSKVIYKTCKFILIKFIKNLPVYFIDVYHPKI